jgi:hypothetical protein
MHETAEYDETATRRAMLAMVGGSVGALGLGTVTAKKKRKKKKKPAPAPLAFAIGVVTAVAQTESGFVCVVDFRYRHPASGAVGSENIGIEVDFEATGDAVRARISAVVQENVADTLKNQGVTADRVSVVLL